MKHRPCKVRHYIESGQYLKKVIIGVNADFKGACAIHDMCYEKNDGNASGMRNCDSNFRNNLITVCENVYTSGVDLRREKCIDVALVYYGAVVADHRDNYL